MGVNSNLLPRIHQHKSGDIKGFTQKYNCKILVFFEIYETMAAAIAREKQIKAGSRQKKLALIEHQNPEWRDLYLDLTL